MESDPYTQREMRHLFEDMTKRFDKQDAQLDKADCKLSEVVNRVTIQNGKTSKLEDWSGQARLVIENNSKLIEEYRVDRVRIYTAIAMFSLLGGTIITLAILAIDSKIEKGISTALHKNVKQIITEQ